MNCLVTGCAGFIGSNLVDFLLEKNHNVFGVDNLSTGKKLFLQNAFKYKNFNFLEIDLKNPKSLSNKLKNIDIVFHLSANADVRNGLKNPDKDLNENTIVTFNILNAMKDQNVNKIVFSSTGSIYGDTDIIPTPENSPFPIQTSLYGASKLACEGLISAFSHGYNFQSWIFRFVGILGERYTHGHIFDFYKKLLLDPRNIHILGDGNQKKSYLNINDCLDAIYLAINNANKNINIFNLGLEDYCTVNDSLKWISNNLNLKPIVTYEGGKRGWIGDNPHIELDISRIKKLGWKPKKNIKESVIDTLNYLKKHKNIFFTYE